MNQNPLPVWAGKQLNEVKNRSENQVEAAAAASPPLPLSNVCLKERR